MPAPESSPPEGRSRPSIPWAANPAIIVPIVESELSRLHAHTHAVLTHRPDVVEWRADHLGHRGYLDPDTLREGLRIVSQAVCSSPERPALLVTIRTSQEGGEVTLTDQEYAAALSTILTCGFCDAIDVECMRDSVIVSSVIAQAHSQGSAVVGSSHDFTRTPPVNELIARLQRMENLGADIAKCAVMPQTRRDVLQVLEATERASSGEVGIPPIMISMGKLGSVTRVAGHHFGSIATFASATTASAPGQFPVDTLRMLMNQLPA